MNRAGWERQVYESDLCPTARLVALVVGSFGNWTDERTVWPSTTVLAEMAGLGRDTTQKYIDDFQEQGWLRLVRVRPGGVKEYELCTPIAEPFGNLAKGKRVMSQASLDQLRRGSTKSIAEPIGNRLPNASGSRLPNPSGAIVEPFGKNLKEPTNMNLQENLLEETAAAGASTAPSDDEEVSEGDQTTLNVQEVTHLRVLSDVQEEPAETFSDNKDETPDYIKKMWETRQKFQRVAT